MGFLQMFFLYTVNLFVFIKEMLSTDSIMTNNAKLDCTNQQICANSTIKSLKRQGQRNILNL